MVAVCNNSFIIEVKTEGFALSNEDIGKMIKKRFGRNTSFRVSEYVPPPPKIKVYPEKKAGDWSRTIKTRSKMIVDPKLPKTPPLKTVPKFLDKPKKEKVYCKDCLCYNDALGQDCLSDPDNYKYKDTWYMRERVTVDPEVKNRNNDCKDFIDKNQGEK